VREVYEETGIPARVLYRVDTSPPAITPSSLGSRWNIARRRPWWTCPQRNISSERRGM
jgi:8-oxo-dGTP pyrophosphatase MutT (NUDIX family)